MDRLQVEENLRASKDRLEADLAKTAGTRGLVESLDDGQVIQVPLSSKGFLLGKVLDATRLHVKLGAAW